MTIQDVCREKKAALKMTAQDIADVSGIPLSTVNNFFAHASKSPALYTTAPICAALGVSLDEFFGITDRLTTSEETLQAEKDGLEHRLENKRHTIGLMETELHNLRHSVKLYRRVVFAMSVIILILIAWCIYFDLHCLDIGFWRG